MFRHLRDYNRFPNVSLTWTLWHQVAVLSEQHHTPIRVHYPQNMEVVHTDWRGVKLCGQICKYKYMTQSYV